MTDVSEKSRGAAFAEQQLLRHGWEHGKGLGRAENGISEPIKVKVKCDKGGVGHREGEQFSFHWWDHVFNKASSSLQVQAHQDGIEVKKTTEEEEGGTISNRKPRKAALARDKLYGCFVKSATLLAGQEQPEPKLDDSSSSSSSSDEEEEQKLDLSSASKLSDTDLMKACGGRTAHKGARHGLTMSAKLARLEQQEAEFMARYGQRNQPQRSSPVCVAESSPSPEEEVTKEHRSKKKKKKKKKSAESCEEGICPENDEEHQTKQKEKNMEGRVRSPAAETLKETCEPLTKVKKKKKTSKHHCELAEDNPKPAELEEVTVTTKKSKKRKQRKEKHMNFNPADEEDALPKKKKKKKSKTAD